MNEMIPPAQITDPAILIRISQMYSPALSAQALYEATRGVWVIGKRRERAQYAFSVASGVIQEVFSVHSWHTAGSTPYSTRSHNDVDYQGRWEFIGEVAPSSIRLKYVGCSVAHYFRRGAANPIMYLNCDR